MPGGDRTGPMGMGPMTGRARGLCAGYGMPGYMNPLAGRGGGFGFGRGRGLFGGRRGWRHWFHATGVPGWMRFGGWGGAYPYPVAEPDPKTERRFLQEQAEALEGEIHAIRKRIEELAATDGE